MDENGEGRRDDDADGREIAHHVEWHFLVDGGIHHQHAAGAREQGVAIWHGFRHHIKANQTIGAGAIVNNEILAKGGGEVLRHGAAHHIRHATCRGWIDDAHSFGRPFLGMGVGRGEDGDCDGCTEQA